MSIPRKSLWMAFGLVAIGLFAGPPCLGQVGRTREPRTDSSRDRDGASGRDRNRDEGRAPPSTLAREQGTEEGMPEVPAAPGGRVRPTGGGWRLGVWGVNSATGVRVTYVVPNSPGWRAGLEPGDVIIAVDGYQVGIVGGRTYYLGEELQRRAGQNGEVTLLVHNVRNRDLMNVDAALTRSRPEPVPVPYSGGRSNEPKGLRSPSPVQPR